MQEIGREREIARESQRERGKNDRECELVKVDKSGVLILHFTKSAKIEIVINFTFYVMRTHQKISDEIVLFFLQFADKLKESEGGNL